MIALCIIAVYLLMLLALGLFSNRMFRGTSKDYMLASHSIGPFMLLMSLFGTTMTAFALVGSSGEAFKVGIGVYGMLASSSGIIHSLCFFVVGLKIWDIGRRYDYRTQIQFFRERLDNGWIGLLLFPILVGLVIPYLLIGVLAAGTVINSVSEGAFAESFARYDYGLPPWLGSLVICIVVLLYVFFGGMRGTAWANTFQTLVFMVLGVVTFTLIAGKLGGAHAASEAVLERNTSKLMRSVTAKETDRYEQQYTRWAALAQFNWAAKTNSFALDAAQEQEAFEQFKPRGPNWQRSAEAVFAARHDLIHLTPEEKQKAKIAQDDRVLPNPPPPGWMERKLSRFRRSTDWEEKALTKYAANIGHPTAPLNSNDPDGPRKWTRRRALGIYRATQWAPEEPNPMSKLKFFTYLLVPFSVGMFPHLFQHWLTARSAAAFKLPIVAHPIFIMIVWVPCVLVGIWATSAVIDGRPLVPPHFPANAVLAFMVKNLAGPVLGGLLTAGILAAIMSSLDSQFLCIGTMFTNDIVVHYSGEGRFSERQKVLMARLFIVAVVAITYGFSLFEPRRVFTLGVWCFSGFSSVFPIVLAALYWKRLTALGAAASVIVATVVWVILFQQSDYGLNSDYVYLGMMPVATIMACSVAALVAVSWVTQPPSKEILVKFFDSPAHESGAGRSDGDDATADRKAGQTVES